MVFSFGCIWIWISRLLRLGSRMVSQRVIRIYWQVDCFLFRSWSNLFCLEFNKRQKKINDRAGNKSLLLLPRNLFQFWIGNALISLGRLTQWTDDSNRQSVLKKPYRAFGSLFTRDARTIVILLYLCCLLVCEFRSIQRLQVSSYHIYPVRNRH